MRTHKKQILILFLNLVIGISLISGTTIFTTKTYAQKVITSRFVLPKSPLFNKSEFLGKFALQVENGKLILYKSKNSKINDIIIEKKIIYFAIEKNNIVNICKYDTVNRKNVIVKTMGINKYRYGNLIEIVYPNLYKDSFIKDYKILKYYKGAVYYTKESKKGLYKINLKSPKKVLCLSKEDVQDIVSIDDCGLYFCTNNYFNYSVSLNGKKIQQLAPKEYQDFSLFIDEGKLFTYNSPSGIYQIEKNKLRKVFENGYGDITNPNKIFKYEMTENDKDLGSSILINRDFHAIPLCVNSDYIYYTMSDWLVTSPHAVSQYEESTGKKVVENSTLRRANLNNGKTEILLDLNKKNYKYIGKFFNIMYFMDNENNLFVFNTDKKIMQQLKYDTRILGN